MWPANINGVGFCNMLNNFRSNGRMELISIEVEFPLVFKNALKSEETYLG